MISVHKAFESLRAACEIGVDGVYGQHLIFTLRVRFESLCVSTLGTAVAYVKAHRPLVGYPSDVVRKEEYVLSGVFGSTSQNRP